MHESTIQQNSIKRAKEFSLAEIYKLLSRGRIYTMNYILIINLITGWQQPDKIFNWHRIKFSSPPNSSHSGLKSSIVVVAVVVFFINFQKVSWENSLFTCYLMYDDKNIYTIFFPKKVDSQISAAFVCYFFK